MLGIDELRRLSGYRQKRRAWEKRGVPWDVVGPILAGRLKGGPPTPSPRTEVQYARWLDPQERRKCHFTVFAEIVRRLEVLSTEENAALDVLDTTTPRPYSYALRKAWDALHAIFPYVERHGVAAGVWKEDDWQRFINVDYWKKITKTDESVIDDMLRTVGLV